MTRNEIMWEWTTVEFLHRLQWLSEKNRAETFDFEQQRILNEVKAKSGRR